MARIQVREGCVLKIAFKTGAGEACNIRRLYSANRVEFRGLETQRRTRSPLLRLRPLRYAKHDPESDIYTPTKTHKAC